LQKAFAFYVLETRRYRKGYGCIKFLQTMKTAEKLQAIIARYNTITCNDSNYSIGGGLDSDKFASRRHENARNDDGKITLGEAVQLFRKATGLETEEVKDILIFAVPMMEWHHAGKLPKAYGGGMKKTYFLNSKEIVDIASNWDTYTKRLSRSKITASNAVEERKSLEARKAEFLLANAKKVERISTRPILFVLLKREMNGKYGWFDSTGKSYNLPEYYTGWVFENESKYNEYIHLQ
jgi:hypothetical protein